MTATITPSTSPSRTMRTRMSKLGVGQPVGDERADLVSLVFLQEVSAVVDDGELLGGREQRLHVAPDRVEWKRWVGVAPHQEGRALVGTQRLGHRLTLRGAGIV